jgi:DNA-directed RNA polymerase specialized sigma24 family protein
MTVAAPAGQREPALPPVAPADRRRAAREAARRREAMAALRVAEATIVYAQRQIGNGLSPAQARQAALEAAGELEVLAGELRRAIRLGPAERRVLARQLAALGMSRREVAARLGVSERAVWGYLRPRVPAGE